MTQCVGLIQNWTHVTFSNISNKCGQYQQFMVHKIEIEIFIY